MTPSFARRYKRVVALDLSAEMLQRARQIHVEQQNIQWLRVGGADLACLASGRQIFCLATSCSNTCPRKTRIRYIREFLRVLRPGGAFLFQFNGSHKPTMNSRGRLAWGTVDALWAPDWYLSAELRLGCWDWILPLREKAGAA